MKDLETAEGFLDYIYSNIAKWSRLEFPKSLRPDYKYISISVTCKDPYMLGIHGSLSLTSIDNLDVKIKEYLMLTSTHGKSEAKIMSITRAVVDPNEWESDRISLKRVVKAEAFLDYDADSFHTSISSVSVLDSNHSFSRSYKDMPQINIKKVEGNELYYTIVWRQYQAQYLSKTEPGRLSLYIQKDNGNVVRGQASWFLVEDSDLSPVAKHRASTSISKDFKSGSITGPSFIKYKNSSPKDMIDTADAWYLGDDSKKITKDEWARSPRVKKYRIQLVRAAMKKNK